MLDGLGTESASASVQCRRARALLGLGKYKEAGQAAAAAQAASPNSEWGFRLGAIAARKQGRAKVASALADEAVRLAPHEPNTHQVATLTRLDLRDVPRALQHARTLVDLAPHQAKSHTTYARALIAHKDLAGAEASLRRALTVDPNDAETLSLLADVVGEHDKDQARELRLAAVRADPQNSQHRANLLRRGGITVGGTALALGKLGIAGKLAVWLSIAGLRSFARPVGVVLLVLVAIGYVATFVVTRIRRHRDGRSLPPLMWEGLKDNRRNADLLWIGVPAALIGVVAGLIAAGQALASTPVSAAYLAVPGFFVSLVCWLLRRGEARDTKLHHIALGLTLLGQQSLDRRLVKRIRVQTERSRWSPGPGPTVAKRAPRAARMLFASFLAGSGMSTALGPGWILPLAMLVAAALGAVLDGQDRGSAEAVVRVVLVGTTTRPGRARLAVRAALRGVLILPTLLLVLGRSERPVRLWHDRATGTELVTLAPLAASEAPAEPATISQQRTHGEMRHRVEDTSRQELR